MPTERPDLPSLDEALATGIPDNATFPITETPPPGYMTDENEPVSPSSSAGKLIQSENIIYGIAIYFQINFSEIKIVFLILCYILGMNSPGEPIITSASPGDPYSIGKSIR